MTAAVSTSPAAAAASSAPSKDVAGTTPAGSDSGEDVSTMFNLPLSGRNFAGMPSQVLRPITAALRLAASRVSVVAFLKYFMSPGRRVPAAT